VITDATCVTPKQTGYLKRQCYGLGMTADELLATFRRERDRFRRCAPWMVSSEDAAHRSGLHPLWAKALLEELQALGHLVKAVGEDFWLFAEDDAGWARALSLPG
jgi:hypothetical protein